MDVDLRREDPGDGDSERFGVWIDSAKRADLTIVRERPVPSVSMVALEAHTWTRDEIRSVVRAIPAHMDTSFEFALNDPLFRYEARAIGFSGGLRAPLARWGGSAAFSVQPGDAEGLAAAINALLGRPAVQAGRPPR